MHLMFCSPTATTIYVRHNHYGFTLGNADSVVIVMVVFLQLSSHRTRISLGSLIAQCPSPADEGS